MNVIIVNSLFQIDTYDSKKLKQALDDITGNVTPETSENLEKVILSIYKRYKGIPIDYSHQRVEPMLEDKDLPF